MCLFFALAFSIYSVAVLFHLATEHHSGDLAALAEASGHAGNQSDDHSHRHAPHDPTEHVHLTDAPTIKSRLLVTLTDAIPAFPVFVPLSPERIEKIEPGFDTPKSFTRRTRQSTPAQPGAPPLLA